MFPNRSATTLLNESDFPQISLGFPPVTSLNPSASAKVLGRALIFMKRDDQSRGKLLLR